MPKRQPSRTHLTTHAKGLRLAIFAGLCLGSALYIGKYLASRGSSGDHYAQVWGTAISFLSLVSGIWFGVHQITHQKQRSHADPPPTDGDVSVSKTFSPVH